MKIRVIYQVMVVTEWGELVARRFARNKRTAERIATKYTKVYGDEFVGITKLGKHDMCFVALKDVEG